MHMFFDFGLFKIPAYGSMIVLGIFIVNIIAYFIVKKYNQNFLDLLLLEAFGFLGGAIGSKGLYFFVSRDLIDWSRITEMEYLNALMMGGWVFYGGIILGVIFVFLASRWFKIEGKQYLNNLVFLFPLAHAFGRVGCFFAGCCYGIPYDGPIAVVYPESSLIAPSGIKMFPVQLVEAGLLLLIFIILGILRYVLKSKNTLAWYCLLYGIVRFVLEKYRYDAARGILLGLSTSQWISIVMIVAPIVYIIIKTIKNKKNAQ